MKLLLLLFLVCFAFCTSSKKRIEDCQRFAKGNFVINKYQPDSAYYITRNDSLQIETDQHQSYSATLKIVWKKPCEYDLIFQSRIPDYPEGTSEEKKSFLNSVRKIATHCKITEVGSDYYVFEAVKSGINMVFRDTMWVTK